jgi:hypothetical protein
MMYYCKRLLCQIGFCFLVRTFLFISRSIEREQDPAFVKFESSSTGIMKTFAELVSEDFEALNREMSEADSPSARWECQRISSVGGEWATFDLLGAVIPHSTREHGRKIVKATSGSFEK